MEPDKCDELVWFGIDSLPDNTIDYIRAAIENYKENVLFSIYGWQQMPIDLFNLVQTSSEHEHHIKK